MATKQLKQYQETAVDELVVKTKLLLGKNVPNRTIVFQSPTGSGKTFMMSQYICQLIDELKDLELCFLWLSPGEGKLHQQSFKSLKKEFAGFPDVYLLEEEFFGTRRKIEKNEVVVGNWEKLSNKDSKTGEWKNLLMKDKETINFRELMQYTRESGIKVILIIDESHSRDKAERAFELRNDIVRPDLTIEMSATPILREGQYQEKVEVDPNQVIDQGMIKKEVVINMDIDKIDDDEITSQELIMEAAFHKREQLVKELKKAGSKVNPLVLVQLPVSDAGEEKKAFVESFLAEKDITKDNGKLAVWLSEEKVNQEEELIVKNDSPVEFLIFKQAIDTGWDCPRAQILVKFRETKSLIFEIQTVGRILRMPEIKHYNNDDLNRAYVFTNVKSFVVKYENKFNPNIIKSVFVKRADIYKPLKLRSYYRNRVDYGDITASFYNSLERVFCNYFGMAADKFDFGFADKNKKLLEKKKVALRGLEGKDEIILNKQLPAKYFDAGWNDYVKDAQLYSANLSEEDKFRAFENLIRLNLNGFAFKRSIAPVKNALYKWFKKYLGINLLDNGIIYVQNIILNNDEVFSRLLDEAVQAYRPEKEKEVRQKIKDLEMWNNGWEISETRNFNPNLYKPFSYSLSLYKNPHDKKSYLNFDSSIENEFIEFLEAHKDKVLWWWQNGNEHMALNFGIKYGNGSTFQPDFLVMLKNGKLAIFDTKAEGFNELDNKVKAEALQKYIKEENKKRKNNLLWGGLVIKRGEHFLVDSDDAYKVFKDDRVAEGKTKYGKEGRGWSYLEL
ncbi:MAG: DEAD/DEAH box helicase family protein [Patescibacteria group bacterium]|nr:DEAD/DEAH box helicase family protein [Patescibacteria group bacterium]